MANLIKRIRTNEGDLQIDYNALANLPCYTETTEIAEQVLAFDYDIAEVVLDGNIQAGDTLHVEINDNGTVTNVDLPIYSDADGLVWFEGAYPEGCNCHLEAVQTQGVLTIGFVLYDASYEGVISVIVTNERVTELTEKFIPDTIARKEYVDNLVGTANAELERILAGGVD